MNFILRPQSIITLLSHWLGHPPERVDIVPDRRGSMSASASTSQAGESSSNERQPPSTLPAWPPKLTPNQLEHLLTLSTTYALAHGFTLLPPAPTFPPTSTVAAPLSLFPTPFPRALYHLARELQPLYNALYARIALDWAFLDSVFAGVSEVDAFQGSLWKGWKSVRDELSQVCASHQIDVELG